VSTCLFVVSEFLVHFYLTTFSMRHATVAPLVVLLQETVILCSVHNFLGLNIPVEAPFTPYQFCTAGHPTAGGS
jgi:hypothetical protein